MTQFPIEALYDAAMACTACFHPGSKLQLATIDVPQPRWIGPRYYESKPRVLIAMLNPGQGDGPQLAQNLRLKGLLHQYRQREATLTDVLEFQRGHMRQWGRPQGRFLPFYTVSLGLELDAISFINIALCATKANNYPRSMLSRCFDWHTGAIARHLNPDIILLSGAATHGFATKFRHCLPHAKVWPMLHYAHRLGLAVERRELERIRTLLSETE